MALTLGIIKMMNGMAPTASQRKPFLQSYWWLSFLIFFSCLVLQLKAMLFQMVLYVEQRRGILP